VSTKNQVERRESEPATSSAETRNEAEQAPQPQEPEIRIGKGRVPAEMDGQATQVDLFTLALGDEAIFLQPFKTWSQMDTYKWRVQGKLPGTPPGLEITVDRVKVAGETVATNDPDGCEKLEKVLNEWLTVERAALERAKEKSQRPPEPPVNTSSPEEALRFHVELDKTGQPHILCFEGAEMVADVACTVPGITSLINEGLIRKPGAWKIGALRDWLELDGKLFRFKEGKAALAELERVLNEQYHPAAEGGTIQSVLVFANAGSESGFDIQFPANDNGVADRRRRHLDAAAMELLSDPRRCRVLRKGIVVRFTPPKFHFKQKTPDGGERELGADPENIVPVVGQDGLKKWIDLSQPVNHLGLGSAELTAIFNHPSITRRVRRADSEEWAKGLDQAA
jgi:hypothetical protein